METRRLGNTGLSVSRLGLGLAALGRPGYINVGHAADLGGEVDLSAMEARTHAVLDAAWQAGIRYFDAARSYGCAEVFLASWLKARNIDSASVTVGSKWGYSYTAEWKVRADRHEVKDHSLRTLVRQVAESQAILGTYLNLYQIHSATLDSEVLEDRSVLDELARLRDKGLKIGLSLTGPRQAETLRRALDVNVAGECLFGCVQATWNLLEQSAGAALREAKTAGLGVIVKEALANGRLTTRHDVPDFARQRQRLLEAASELGSSLDTLALAAVLAQPWADVVLSGATTTVQLYSNLAAQNVSWDCLDHEVFHSLVESPEEYWSNRSLLPWN